MRLYIDPGTGSMLFAILIGIIGAVRYVIKIGMVKLKFILSGGKKVEGSNEKFPFVIFADSKDIGIYLSQYAVNLIIVA